MTPPAPQAADEIESLALRLGECLAGRDWMVATAESCTGGGIAAAITDIAGSSAWFDRGFVTYSNAAKQELLGVAAETLARVGAVSEETAAEMARGALLRSAAYLSVSVTGVAGPGGGSAEKPVGTVCFGFATRNGPVLTRRHLFAGDRAAVRRQTVHTALEGLLALAGGQEPR